MSDPSDPRQTPLPALIVFSSRTGRTARAAQALKTHLEWRNYAPELLQIGNGAATPDLAPYRLVVFGYPEGGIPLVAPRPDKRMLSFIAALPPLDGRKVAVFALQAVESDRSTVGAVKAKLIDKGADVVAVDTFPAATPDRDVADLACEVMIRVYR